MCCCGSVRQRRCADDFREKRMEVLETDGFRPDEETNPEHRVVGVMDQNTPESLAEPRGDGDPYLGPDQAGDGLYRDHAEGSGVGLGAGSAGAFEAAAFFSRSARSASRSLASSPEFMASSMVATLPYFWRSS